MKRGKWIFFEIMELSCILIGDVVTGVYTTVKTHQTVPLMSRTCAFCPF